MAIQMILCPACKKKVSIEAQACPHCGQPITDETRAEGVKRSKQRGWGCLTVILVFAGIVWFGESARTAAPLPGTGNHQSESLVIPTPKQEVDVKTIVQDTFREFIALNHISATEMDEAARTAGELGKGATVKKLRDELEDVQLTATACYGSINDVHIPDDLPDNIKKHIINGRSDFLTAVQLRKEMATTLMNWIDTGDNLSMQNVQKTSNMVSTALFSGMGSYTTAMSLAGFSNDEIQEELGFISGNENEASPHGATNSSSRKSNKENNGAQELQIKYTPHKTTDKPGIKLSYDVVIDLIDKRLPRKEELLSVAHQVLGNSTAAGQWVNFYLPQMNRKDGWFASVEIKNGKEKISFNENNLPNKLKHLYQE